MGLTKVVKLVVILLETCFIVESQALEHLKQAKIGLRQKTFKLGRVVTF